MSYQHDGHPRRLYFLHATGWEAEAGRQVAVYVVHYANGFRRFVPVLYGQDVMDWQGRRGDKLRNMGAQVVWEEPVPAPVGEVLPARSRRLFVTSWDNPQPEAELESLDFVSMVTDAAPFLVAITAE